MFRISNFFKIKRWIQVTVLGVLLALLGYLAWVFAVTPWIWCGPDVKRIDEQCIGVTDGQVALIPDLAEVLDRIHQENQRVEREGSEAVGVAYLLPLPKGSADERLEGYAQWRHELQGAYIAQLQANRSQELGDRPLIRLLVANSGDQSSQRHRVVPALLGKVSGPDRLVAVVATGNTVSATLETIQELRAEGLPVVLSRLAGDGLPDPEQRAGAPGGIARLAPSGSDQGAAAAAYLRPTANRVLIVRDTNPEDTYLQGLDEAFRAAFPDGTHTVLEPPETYDSRLAGVPNAMQGILRNTCVQKPEVVFFAGRAPAMGAFVQALPRRPCPELPINIMSAGSSADFATRVALGDPALVDGLNSNASVRYTAQTHPDAWTAAPESFHPASTSRLSETCDYCFATVFRGETLADGGVTIGYDAIVTTVAAIRPVQGGVPNTAPELVSQALKGLHGSGAVPGATGWISLDPLGNPVNKAVVILEVKPAGRLEFLTLSSPLGSPCVPGTPPC